MQRSEECSSPREVALGLCDSRLEREGIDVIRDDIEHLIKLSQCLGETTKTDVGCRVLVEHGNVARVEALGFVEVRLAPVPFSSPPREIGERFRNPAAIGQELACLLKVTHRRVVILQAGVVVMALGQYGLAEIGLKSERGFGCLPRLFTEGDRWLKTLYDVAARIRVRQQRPG